MSTENQNNIPEEIDLGQLGKKISRAINRFILRTFIFFKKNFYIFLSILILGGVIGFIIDKYSKTYLTEVVVSTNFAGNEYLYSKVEDLNSDIIIDKKGLNNKIKSLKLDLLSKIEIEPVIDIYGFVNNQAVGNNAQNSQNFEMIKLLAESGDINKIIKDKVTSKNYQFQKINIYTTNIVPEKDIKKVIKYLNTDAYFDSILKINLDNTSKRILKNDSILKQIDRLVEGYSKSIEKGSSGVLIKSENSEVSNLINQKLDLARQISYDKLSLVSQSKIVRENTIVYNQENNKGIANKMKFILPIFLVLLFLIIKYLKYLNGKINQI